MAWGGGRYTGAVSASGQPHGFGTLERGADKGEGGPGVSYRGVWSNGVLSVGVRSCPRERLHYEGQFERLERQGMGIEWRVVETPVPAAQQAAATAAGAAAAPAPPAASRIVGEVHRAGRWSRDERVAECPVPRKLLTEARFISEAGSCSRLRKSQARQGVRARASLCCSVCSNAHAVFFFFFFLVSCRLSPICDCSLAQTRTPVLSS